MLLFHQSTMRIYIAFGKCFYICDVVIAKFLFITFLIHKQEFVFRPCSYLK